MSPISSSLIPIFFRPYLNISNSSIIFSLLTKLKFFKNSKAIKCCFQVEDKIMGRCDYINKECDKNSDCGSCLDGWHIILNTLDGNKIVSSKNNPKQSFYI